MGDFDEWYDKYMEEQPVNDWHDPTQKECFEAGQQSQQAKIDSLNKNIEALHVENDRIQKEYQMMFEGVQGRQKTIDELQGRIDDLNSRINKAETFISNCFDYCEVMYIKDDVRKILQPDLELNHE